MQVAVAADVPTLVHGLAAVLEARRYDVVAPRDLASWLMEADDPVVVLAIDTSGLDVVLDLRRVRPRAPLVVLLPRPDDPALLEALRHGATAVESWGVDATVLARIIEAAAVDLVVLPNSLARTLASRAVSPPEGIDPGSREARWLRQLAGGATVTQLAATNDYSEREMYRLLKRLYERLGVNGRVPALMLAARCGLLDPPS